MTLLNKLMETCATLTQKVAHLEHDKVAQALEITKLKQRVRKLERKRRSKHSGLKRLRKERMEEDVNAIKEVNAAEPTVIDDEEMQEKHLDNIKKYQSLKRKPISVAQARKNMIVYLKNMAGYKIQHFKGMTYDQKRLGKETLLQESFKRLRAKVKVSSYHSTQHKETSTVDPAEISKEDVQNMLQIILMVEFKVEALHVKYHLTDWEIYSEGSRSYWRMVRVGGVTQAY
uniref:Uncharacterized protein n=1 Tax=Tanacetum cinerariifolium TaxID=118510 RepID=A0A699J466_TANCI|nr:hypothetical protein [Tanacetum cinerariifolium]